MKEGPPTAPPDGWESLDKNGSRWEWLQLVGTQQILESEGVDRTPEHRHGTRQQQDELKLRERLTRDPEARDRLWDLLVTEEFNSLLDEINEFCEELQIDPRGLFFSDALQMRPPQVIRAFIDDLPSANTWARLRFWKHRDLTHPWEQHDWTDIYALSVAVPYCDVVLTERRWAHIVTLGAWRSATAQMSATGSRRWRRSWKSCPEGSGRRRRRGAGMPNPAVTQLLSGCV